eukprot:SAG31_NODE_2246_length_6099_cov_9.400333_2_plen_221_part_00
MVIQTVILTIFRFLRTGSPEQYATLNPLDKGMYRGLTIKQLEAKGRAGDPQAQAFMRAWQDQTLQLRWPAGESYADVRARLLPIVTEMEQQVAPVLLCTHGTVLQMLYSYFKGQAAEAWVTRTGLNLNQPDEYSHPGHQGLCGEFTIPMHTVLEFRPRLGGSWAEVRYTLPPAEQGNALVRWPLKNAAGASESSALTRSGTASEVVGSVPGRTSSGRPQQ